MKLRTWEEIVARLNGEENNFSVEYYFGDMPEYKSVETRLEECIANARAGKCYDVQFVRAATSKRFANTLNGVHNAALDLESQCVEITRENQNFKVNF